MSSVLSNQGSSMLTSSTGGTAVVDSVSKENVCLSEKRRHRAERFGLPVMLSEEEKRYSRAERFGISSTEPGVSVLKVPEELKRKARAERFGLPVQSVVDEETKKKARAAKYEPGFVPNAVEEDKRKARALRFSQSSLISTPQLNDRGEIEPARPLEVSDQ